MKFVWLALMLVLSVAARGDRDRVSLFAPADVELEQIKKQANQIFQKADYPAAERAYQQGLQRATGKRNRRAAGRFLTGIGNCALMSMDYRKALENYVKSQTIATAEHDSELLGIVASNLFNVYGRTGQSEAARAAAEEAVRLARTDASSAQRYFFLLNAAKAESQTGHAARAVPLFRDGIEAAEMAGDWDIAAEGLSGLGYHYLLQGDVEAADRAHSRAFYIRKTLAPRGLAGSYLALATVRLAQGEPEAAIRFLSVDLEMAAKKPVGLPMFFPFHQRARAYAALGNLTEAIGDYETAIEMARQWRADVPSADATATGSEVELQQIYEGYIATGMKLYQKTHNEDLAFSLFLAAEENRSLSFRERLQARRNLPIAYWQALSTLRKAEGAAFRNETLQGRASVDQLRLRLTEIEALNGFNNLQLPAGSWYFSAKNSHRKNERNRSVFSLSAYRNSIEPTEALLSFHLGEKESYLWAFTRENFQVVPLSGRAQLAGMVQQFRESVRGGLTADGASQGAALYLSLFGGLESRVATKRHWVLVIEDALFELPFAALVTGNGNGSLQYLIERNALRVLPSAEFLAIPPGRAPLPVARGRFVGVSDPIFNTADSRWDGQRPSRWALFWKAHAGSPADLPRLPATWAEIQACARAWSSSQPALLLEGAQTRREYLTRILASRPAVIHFATHVVQTRQKDQSMIAIGLDREGEADYLTTSEISASRYEAGLVVLSGCGSGLGKALPGAGLFGLTRAWLLAGARTVAATGWPIADDAGPLMQAFYSHYRAGASGLNSASAAEALQAGQIDMLRAGGWRAKPVYWAAFFLTGRD